MLGMLRDANAINEAIIGFLMKAPDPTSWDVVDFLRLYSGTDRELAAQLLVQRGVSASSVNMAKTYTATDSFMPIKISPIWMMVSVVSSALSAYHGYKRNNSIGWGIGWGLLGGLAPILTPAIAFGQGFGKPKKVV
jgi:hypothetical protein